MMGNNHLRGRELYLLSALTQKQDTQTRIYNPLQLQSRSADQFPIININITNSGERIKRSLDSLVWFNLVMLAGCNLQRGGNQILTD